MKKINPDKMSKTQLDRLGAAAERVAYRTTHPLRPQDRRALARAAHRAGRPRIGAGAQRINITVEHTLLSHADAYARKHGLSRAALVAEGLMRVLAA